MRQEWTFVKTCSDRISLNYFPHYQLLSLFIDIMVYYHATFCSESRKGSLMSPYALAPYKIRATACKKVQRVLHKRIKISKKLSSFPPIYIKSFPIVRNDSRFCNLITFTENTVETVNFFGNVIANASKIVLLITQTKRMWTYTDHLQRNRFQHNQLHCTTFYVHSHTNDLMTHFTVPKTTMKTIRVKWFATY